MEMFWQPVMLQSEERAASMYKGPTLIRPNFCLTRHGGGPNSCQWRFM